MPYPGGKSGAGVYQTIINHIPPHEVYIEPFVGGGGVFNNLRRAASSIVIDSDAEAIAAFQQIPGITAIHGDGLQYLERRKYTGREFIYADPPYLMKTRRSKRPIYSQEWDTADHVRFLKLVKDLPCSIAISGYQSRLYDETLTGWRSITFTAQTRRGPATETLWMNYPDPTALHDCRYLGGDYRERERIKRKATRWASNFDAMPPLERQAVLSAMIERAGYCTAIHGDTGIEHRQIERCAPDPIAINDDKVLNRQVAALYVQKGGAYYNLDGVDPWDEARDARRYSGPHPVIAHPPCQRWGKMWAGQPLWIKRTGKRKKKGDDNGCFKAALDAVRKYGGVLEHPYSSYAWPHFGLAKPPRSGGWIKADDLGGWTCCVEQGRYGHYARKPTLLYVVGVNRPELDWGISEPSFPPEAIEKHGLEYCKKQGELAFKGGGKDSASRIATPLPFRNLLISMARTVPARKTTGCGMVQHLDIFGTASIYDAD